MRGMIPRLVKSIKPLLLAIVLMIVGVTAAEFWLRLALASPKPGSGAGEGLRAYIEFSDRLHHRLTRSAEWVETNPDTSESISVRTNSLGLRSDEVVVPKPANTFRILCLGGDAVAGLVTASQDLFSSRLEQLLLDRSDLQIEVINAGVPKYCPLLSYLQVKHELLALQPDLLVLSMEMDDIAEDYRYRRFTENGADRLPTSCPYPLLVDQSSNDEDSGIESLQVFKWCRRRLQNSWEYHVTLEENREIGSPLADYAWIRDDPPDWSIHIRQALSALDQLKMLANANSCQLIVAVVPAPWQISATASNGGQARQNVGVADNAHFTSRAPFRIISEYAIKHGIAYCDASQFILESAHRDKLYLKNAAELSQVGHDLYARILAGYIAWQFISRRPAVSGNASPPSSWR